VAKKQERDADKRRAPSVMPVKAKRRTGRGRYPDGCVVSKRKIESLIDNTLHRQAVKICAIMLGVTKACLTAWPSPHGPMKERLTAGGVNLLAALPLLDSDPDLRSILKLIEDAVHDGVRGIEAANKTAIAFLAYTFRDQPDWEVLASDFEGLMKDAGLEELLTDLQ